MTDRYQEIRDALAMGPTPGPWAAKSYAAPRADNGDIGIINGKGTLVAVAYSNTCTRDNAAHIAACDPDTIDALLKERDALRKLVQAVVENRGVCFIPTLGTDTPDALLNWDERARAALADGEASNG